MANRLTGLLKAFKSAQDRLESSSLIDKLGRGGEIRKKGSAPTTAEVQHLVSRADVAEATGADVGAPSEMATDDYAGWEFRTGDGLWVQVNTYKSPDAEAVWKSLLADVPDHTEMSGLGDSAFRSAGHVFVRKAGKVFFVAGSDAGGRNISDALEALARTVAGRV
jgi:hypothetical protein